MVGYKQLKIPIVDNDGNPAWPEMFPLKKIQELHTVVGDRHFSAQMMLEYVAEERICLDPGALKFYDNDFDNRTCRLGEHLITGVCAYWDPSSGRGTSDGSVCVLVYRDDKNRTAFVHDILYMTVTDDDLHPLATQCDGVLSFLQKHKLNNLGVEINGIGNALPEILRQVADARHFTIHINQIANHTKKETRILNAIEPLLTTGRLFAHNTIQQSMLLSEMLAWTPIGSKEHDDGLDALAGALAMMPSPTRPLITRNGLIKANTEFKI